MIENRVPRRARTPTAATQVTVYSPVMSPTTPAARLVLTKVAVPYPELRRH